MLVKAVVNVRVVNVEADSMEAALEKCCGEVEFDRLFKQDFHLDNNQWPDLPAMTLAYTEHGDEFNESLVDVVGDEEYENSRWIK